MVFAYLEKTPGNITETVIEWNSEGKRKVVRSAQTCSTKLAKLAKLKKKMNEIGVFLLIKLATLHQFNDFISLKISDIPMVRVKFESLGISS